MEITVDNTALVLIGYQNDYFTNDGILHGSIECPKEVLDNTLRFINKVVDTDMMMIATPIIFTPSYEELNEPIGILKVIKDIEAFKEGNLGSDCVQEILEFQDRIVCVPGKIGLNSFVDTYLDSTLQEKDIKNIIFAGAVTSICIDSTGRSAAERGYHVIMLSDATSARSSVEQAFYCEEVFPIYATVMTTSEALKELGIE